MSITSWYGRVANTKAIQKTCTVNFNKLSFYYYTGLEKRNHSLSQNRNAGAITALSTEQKKM